MKLNYSYTEKDDLLYILGRVIVDLKPYVKDVRSFEEEEKIKDLIDLCNRMLMYSERRMKRNDAYY